MKKIEQRWDSKLYVKTSLGDDRESPQTWICCKAELVHSENFPRDIRAIEHVIFTGPDNKKTRELAQKLVDMYNEIKQ